MAKISKRISQEDKNEEQPNKEPNNRSGGISKKIGNEETPSNDAAGDEHGPHGQESQEAEKPLSAEEITHWFVTFFGEDVFNHVKENPNFNMPFTEDGIGTEEWLNKALKTVFTLEDIRKMGKAIREKYYNVVSDLDEIRHIKDDYRKVKRELDDINDDYEVTRSKKKKLEKEIKHMLPGEPILDAFFDDEGKTSEIGRILKESLQNPSDEPAEFIIAFLKGWKDFAGMLEKSGDDEKENIDIAQDAGRSLLKRISGKYMPERRALLDAVADYLNTYFNDFIFISPEQSLQIDPSIHNAKGVGGSRIKEGVSFAVLRKDNKQTYYYADIKAQ